MPFIVPVHEATHMGVDAIYNIFFSIIIVNVFEIYQVPQPVLVLCLIW